MKKRNTCAWTILLLLCAGEALFVQSTVFNIPFLSALGQSAFRRLLLIDLAAAGLLLVLPRAGAAALFVLQTLLSFFILNYFLALGESPTVTAVVNGFGLLHETGQGVLSFIVPWTVIYAAGILGGKLFLLCQTRQLQKKSRTWVALASIAVLLGFSLSDIARDRFDVLARPRQGVFNNALLPHIKRRGHTQVWLQEWVQNRPGKMHHIFQEKTCSDKYVRELPLVPLEPGMALIQVESLDAASIGLREQGELVAPFLTDLATKSLFLLVDGKKMLASANSDYEVLNAKVAECEILYYEFIPAFPDSIVRQFSACGYETSVFHGLQGSYMNLGVAYSRMGFQHQYFAPELVEAGYSRRGDLFMKHVPDAPLFAFAAQKVPVSSPFFHFIVTLTMHGEETVLVPEKSIKAGYEDTLRYFDTALEQYIDSLPDGTVVILYGDHQPYVMEERSGNVPLIVYKKGMSMTDVMPLSEQQNIRTQRIYSRCEIGQYLRRMAGSCLKKTD